MLKRFNISLGTALVLLDYYLIIITSNMTGVAGGAGHAYPSGAPDVTSVFFVFLVVQFSSALSFRVCIIFSFHVQSISLGLKHCMFVERLLFRVITFRPCFFYDTFELSLI